MGTHDPDIYLDMNDEKPSRLRIKTLLKKAVNLIVTVAMTWLCVYGAMRMVEVSTYNAVIEALNDYRESQTDYRTTLPPDGGTDI